MNLLNWIVDPQNKKVLKIFSYIVLFLVAGADFLIERHHILFIWDSIPAFWAAFGFVSCVVLIIVSKFIGHTWLMKKEDYYD